MAGNQLALQRLRQGFSHPFRTMPSQILTQYFRLSQILLGQGDLAWREGRVDDSLQISPDVIRLSTMVPRGDGYLNSFAGCILQWDGIGRLDPAIDYVSVEAALRGARELLDRDRDAPGYADALAGQLGIGSQRCAAMCRVNTFSKALDVLSITGRHDSDPPSREEIDQAIRFPVTPRRQVLADYLRYLNTEIVRARRPIYQRGEPTPIPSDPLNQYLLGSSRIDGHLWNHQQALRRILAVRLAARAYTLRNGHPPVSLAALVPGYLAQVPQDPFAPALLVYRVVSGKVWVYSRGPDGDDDGGEDIGTILRRDDDGDVVTIRHKYRFD